MSFQEWVNEQFGYEVDLMDLTETDYDMLENEYCREMEERA